MRQVLAISIALMTLAAFPVKAGTPTAVFGFELYDTSGEVGGAGHDTRLAMAGALLRDRLAASARFDVVPLDAYRAEIAALGYLDGCNGCELAVARQAGARWSVRGLVHKVSTLILYLQITVTDARSGAVMQTATAGIRGDNDRAWRRGIRYLVEHELTAPR